jgi:F-type H+-transporting ATPase subunit c
MGRSTVRSITSGDFNHHEEGKHVMTSLALAYLSAGIGAGLSVIGAGIGIGRLASAAMEGTARQPTATGDIRTSMIIAAALIEGATLFAVVVCMLLAIKT